MARHVAIVAGRSSYRTPDFLEAASLLRVDVTLVGDGDFPAGQGGLSVCLDDADAAARLIAARLPNLDGLVGVDDQAVLTAAAAADLLNLPHNPVAAVAATRDKARLRTELAKAAVAQPGFRLAPPGAVAPAAIELGFPVVVKPTGLSASRGVIRANDPAEAAVAENRIRSILDKAGTPATQTLLVEEFVPGDEIVVEGLLGHDGLEVLAIIDKPDPLEGPYFEETLFVTPSRHDPADQARAVGLTERTVDALGLETGPIHAEVRIGPNGGCYLIEIAARSIGGLCGRALSFGLLGESLEVLILRSALGLTSPDSTPARPASGVLMLPIPATGTFSGVAGIEEARRIPGIDDITITVATGRRVETLPDGDRYLGFVFAGGPDPDSVETSLRRAGHELSVTIDGEEVRPPTALA
ncbi:MAG: ATP-grasp domain-containing protein [Acidimicrobiia bacterium]|nr:ATP-grasp domain-containing protein [Acidimicrobiia bacterium]